MKTYVRLRLSQILKELGWTQKELAEKTGLSPQSISTLARNPSRISMTTIAKLIDATGKSPDELFETEGKN